MEKHVGIYIHIPFCMRKCIYCDFYSITDTTLQEKYIEALIKQICKFKVKKKSLIVDTIYFGGGTPSVIEPRYINDILTALKSKFVIAKNCEISLELNPGTITASKLSQYKAFGINRLSIGLQSAHNRDLKMLSRIHSRQVFEETFALCRIEGFDNINVDLMYGIPNQSAEFLLQSILYLTNLAPEHISLYCLKVEPNTPLATNKELLDLIPNEDVQYNMFNKAALLLEKKGYMQYEISNFSKQGKECKHNLIYWHSNEYIGFGTGATSYYNDKIYSYKKDIESFIENPLDPSLICDTEDVSSNKEKAKQYLMLAFRLSEGIDTKEYSNRFNLDFENEYGTSIKRYLDSGFMEKTNKGYRLTRKGLLVSNYILSDILDFTKKE